MKPTFFIITVIALLSCSNHDYHSKKNDAASKGKVIINFQPVQQFPSSLIIFLKDSIEKFYPVSITVNKNISFPSNVYYAANNRYRADSAITWLKKIKPDSSRLMVGLTEKDISTSKGNIADYGVFGLGFQPGNSCIISTFRLNKNLSSSNSLKQRLFKVVAHEIGHNLGLKHCADKACIMRDAEGKMVLDDEKYLCSNCKNKLKV